MFGKRAQAGQESIRHNDFGRPFNLLSRCDLVLGARRWTASAAGLAVLGGCQPIFALAAVSPRFRSIGILTASNRSALPAELLSAFLDRRRQLGWTEGDNLSIEWRFAEGQVALMEQLAADLVRLSNCPARHQSDRSASVHHEENSQMTAHPFTRRRAEQQERPPATYRRGERHSRLLASRHRTPDLNPKKTMSVGQASIASNSTAQRKGSD
jgi:hypothetical protein